MTLIHLLAAVPREQAARYYSTLTANGQFELTLTSDSREALDIIDDRSRHFDAFVLDSGLAEAALLLEEVHYSKPRLMVVLVDESGCSPLRAGVRPDWICATPFVNDELERQIARLLSDSQLETVPVNAFMPVRELARKLRVEDKPGDRFRIAVDACRGLGYSYTAFYRVDHTEPLELKLVAQRGQHDVHMLAPLTASGHDIITRVAASGQSVILNGDADEARGYLPLTAGGLGSAAMIAAGRGNCFGVLVAAREKPGAISTQHVAVLELIAAQLAAALSREIGA